MQGIWVTRAVLLLFCVLLTIQIIRDATKHTPASYKNYEIVIGAIAALVLSFVAFVTTFV